MSAEREADINVETDLNGLVGFKVGRGADGRVYLTEAGELAIDFTSDGGGDGVNVNSCYQVGNIRNESNLPSDVDALFNSLPYLNPAFSLTNQDDSNREVTVEYELNPGSLVGSELFIDFRGSDSSYADGLIFVFSGPSSSSVSVPDIQANHTYRKINVLLTTDTNHDQPS